MSRPRIDGIPENILREQSGGRTNRWHLWKLWVSVSTLWTLATLLRVNRVWIPMIGWHRALERPSLWMSLILPPAIFAMLIGAIHRRIIWQMRNALVAVVTVVATGTGAQHRWIDD